jgi:hypothetical protein
MNKPRAGSGCHRGSVPPTHRDPLADDPASPLHQSNSEIVGDNRRMAIRHGVCSWVALGVTIGAGLARAEVTKCDSPTASEVQEPDQSTAKQGAAVFPPQPTSSPASGEACQPDPQREVSSRVCVLPCLLPRSSQLSPDRKRHSPNPVIILCQKDYCLPYSVGCPPGTAFDGYSSCEPPPEDDPFDRLPGLELEAKAKAHSMATRLLYRMRPRTTLELDTGLGFIREPRGNEVDMLSVRAMAGYRNQFTGRSGLQVRVGGRLARATFVGRSPADYSYLATQDETSISGALVEVMPFLGPFGRFYVGPVGQLGYVSYGKNALRSGLDSASLHDGLTAGAGLHGGVALTDTEKLALHFSAIVAHENGLALFFTAGVGLHQ